MKTSTVLVLAVLGFALVTHSNAGVLHVYKSTDADYGSWHGGWDHGHWDHGKLHHEHGHSHEHDWHDYDELHKHHSWEDCHDDGETTTESPTTLSPTTTTTTTTPSAPAVIEIDDQLIQMDNSNATIIEQDTQTTQIPCKESYGDYDKEEHYGERKEVDLEGPVDDMTTGNEKGVFGDARNAVADSGDADTALEVKGPAASDDDTAASVISVPDWRVSSISQAPSLGTSTFLVSNVPSVLTVNPSVTPSSADTTTTAREPAPVVENDQLFNQLFSSR